MADVATLAGKVREKQMKDFGEALLNERLAVAQSQREVAVEVGVDPSSIGNWERAVCCPSKESYDRLIKLFPTLEDVPFPRPNRDDKPVGWTGSHEGAATPTQPEERAKPNRVQRTPKFDPKFDVEVVDIEHEARRRELLKSTIELGQRGTISPYLVPWLKLVQEHGYDLSDVIEVLEMVE